MSELSSCLPPWCLMSLGQHQLLESLSSDIYSRWWAFPHELQILLVLAEARELGLKHTQDTVESLLCKPIASASLDADATLILEISQLFTISALTASDNNVGLGFHPLKNHSEQFNIIVQTCLNDAQQFPSYFDRAIYLNFTLSYLLRDISGAGRFARLYTARSLVRGGYCPIPLIVTAKHIKIFESTPTIEGHQLLMYEFIDNYRATCRVLLGQEPPTTRRVIHSICKKAQAVFGDVVAAERWLSKPTKSFMGLSPRCAALSGDLDKVIERLLQIDEGYGA